MKAKQNTTVAATSLDRLRAALAERARLGALSDELRQKMEKLAPLEAELETAQAKLREILQADEAALRAWIDAGAKGNAPDTNTKEREEAARKVEAARTRITSIAGVRSDLTKQMQECDAKLGAHGDKLCSAYLDVLGEEALRAVDETRQRSIAVLSAEARYFGVMQNLRSIFESAQDREKNRLGGARFNEDGHLTSPTSALNPKFQEWLRVIDDAYKLTDDERQRAAQVGYQTAQKAIEQLLAGEDPKE
jgi:DNA repair exonuclease SbcCD ATPase subunit